MAKNSSGWHLQKVQRQRPHSEKWQLGSLPVVRWKGDNMIYLLAYLTLSATVTVLVVWPLCVVAKRASEVTP